MSDRFVISDLHFFHENIMKFYPETRPFESATEMNEVIVDVWNETVRPNDEVFVLGDVSFGTPLDTFRLLEQLNGRKYLVRGNHDTPKQVDVWGSQFVWVKELAKTNDGVILCHYPLSFWEQSHRGSIHLFGHMHGTYQPQINNTLDIGVDNKILFDRFGVAPRPWEEVLSIAGNQGGELATHHPRKETDTDNDEHTRI